MTTTTTPTCNARSRTPGGRVFICLAPPHPEFPGRHYFQLDSEESYIMDSAPSNAKLESGVEGWFRDEVRRQGGMTIKLVPTTKGLPDRLVLLPGGHVYFVELKADNGKRSAAQEVQQERLANLGMKVYTLTGRGQCSAWLYDRIEENGPQFRKRKLAE